LVEIFTQKEVPPSAVRMFPLKSERSSSGLLEFPSIAQAVLAIMKCNHTAIESKGRSASRGDNGGRESDIKTHSILGTKFPFIMKLCFSSSKNLNSTYNNENDKANGDKQEMM
jgi:heterogeneous nuclear ribonucleoprotein L